MALRTTRTTTLENNMEKDKNHTPQVNQLKPMTFEIHCHYPPQLGVFMKASFWWILCIGHGALALLSAYVQSWVVIIHLVVSMYAYYIIRSINEYQAMVTDAIYKQIKQMRDKEKEHDESTSTTDISREISQDTDKE